MLHDHNLISLTEAAKMLPHRPHASTIWRWCLKGCRGVKLNYTRIGDRVFTSPEALEQFAEKLTALDAERDDPAPAKPRSSRQRDAAVSRAEHDLQGAGW